MTTIEATIAPTATRVIPSRRVTSNLARQTAIEWRKSINTIAGASLVFGTAALIPVIGLGTLLGGPELLGFSNSFSISLLLLSFVVPAIGVISTTSEWANHSALSTFTLEPRRGRVTAAKILAVLGNTLGLIAVAFLSSTAVTFIATMQQPLQNAWVIEPAMVAGATMWILLLLLQGAAIGLATMNNAAGLSIVYLLPTVWMIVTAVSETMNAIAPWLNLGQATQPLAGGDFSSGTLAQVAVASLVGIALPAAIGIWRLATREVK